MDIKLRRVYLTFIVVAFLALAPVVILYSKGYRYDFDQQKVFKTGVLVLESEPEGAGITLNDKKLKNKTPTVISNIIPKEYRITVSKEGYYSWHKNLTVEAEQATLAQSIRLFKDPPEKNVELKKVSLFKISPDEKYIFFLTNNQAKIYNLENEETTILGIGVPKKANKIEWNSNSQKIFLEIPSAAGRNFLITDVDKSVPTIYLNQLFNSPLKLAKWAPEENSFIYLISDDLLYRVDANSKKSSLIISEPVRDYLVVDDTVFYVNKLSNELKSYNLNNRQTNTITNLELKNPRFIKGNKNILTILDTEGKYLYLIEPLAPNSLKMEKFDTKVEDIKWSQSGNRLIYWNDFEIWLLDLDENKKELVTRLSTDLKEVLIYPDEEYIIYSTEEETKILELDGRNSRNFVDLTSNLVKNLFLDKKGENLYYLQNQNLNKLNIF